MLRNLCDVHTHTLFSRHAYSTLRENVLAARDAGLELLGTTEHFSDMLFAGASLEHADMRDYQYFINFGIWPETWEGVRVLHGCEADIRGLDGELFGDRILVDENIVGTPIEPTTLSDRVLAGCDYAIASVHYKGFAADATEAQGTEMYLGALRRDKVLILGHTGRSGVCYDIREVVREAARLHKLIEINEHTFDCRGAGTRATCRKIAEVCAELGCGIAVNTDSHICTSIGQVPHALAMLEEIDFPQELIATRSAEAFLAAMEAGLGASAAARASG